VTGPSERDAASTRPMVRRTESLRPRYGRIATFGTSVLVTATAVLAGAGVLPEGGGPSYAASRTASAGAAGQGDTAVLSAASRPGAGRPNASHPSPVDPLPDGSVSATTPGGSEGTEEPEPAVPADSGEGRRVVFDQGTQRVWLVRADGTVERTYLVSGSVSDNLEPGTYSVFSRNIDAWGIDGSELHFMVRFTTGANAPIGFHNIPLLDGERVQTRDQLGTPLSHGCIRQKRPDAKALWAFAPLGTAVVVVDTSADAGADDPSTVGDVGQSEVG
jgi:hypothetical protein